MRWKLASDNKLRLIRRNEFESVELRWMHLEPVVKWSESRSVKSNSVSPWTVAHQVLCPWDSPGKNTRVGRCSFLQGIVPAQRSNPDLPHCRQILYRLNHWGSPRTLKWVQSEISQKEKNKYHLLMAYIWNLKKNGTEEPIWRAGIETQTQRHVDTVGEGKGGTDWESSIETYTLPCVKQTASGKLPYNTESSAQCSLMT